MSKCDSCSHSEICKHKEDFQLFEQSQSPTDKPFSVEAKCQYFNSNPMIRTMDELQRMYSNQQAGPFCK